MSDLPGSLFRNTQIHINLSDTHRYLTAVLLQLDRLYLFVTVLLQLDLIDDIDAYDPFSFGR